MLLEVDIQKKLGSFHCRMAFTVESERCGVFGPSGSGKSTLLNMLAGLVAPDAGHIVLNGVTLFDKERAINLPPERRRIGVVFQGAELFPHMNVEKNLLYGRNRLAEKERVIEPERLIAALRLETLLSRNVRELSGGERQRVALGRSILACPKLILLDEPLTGLDDQLKYPLIEHLRRIFAEFAIPTLFISHNPREMRLMTDEALVVRDGEIQRAITTEALACADFVSDGAGYENLLDLGEPLDMGDMCRYPWGKLSLILPKRENNAAGRFLLHGRDILLFTQQPGLTSARNVIVCRVEKTYQNNCLVGVALDCQGMTLVAEIVPQSARQLAIRPGLELVAVIKASAFRRLS
jgi:molybdate transport system ATP-binding protein